MTSAHERSLAHSVRTYGSAFSFPQCCCVHAQETTADELEEAYRGEVWNPARGHTEEQKQGITAARVELRTMTQECKVVPTHMLTFLAAPVCGSMRCPGAPV